MIGLRLTLKTHSVGEAFHHWEGCECRYLVTHDIDTLEGLNHVMANIYEDPISSLARIVSTRTVFVAPLRDSRSIQHLNR